MRSLVARTSWSILFSIALLIAAADHSAIAQTAPPAPPSAEQQSQQADADVATLIKILQNDQARERLIARLKTAGTAPPPEKPPAAMQQTLTTALAAQTRRLAQGAGGVVDAVRNLIDEVTQIVTGAADLDVQALRKVALAVGFVVIGTLAVYIVLQILFRWLQRSLAGRAQGARIFRRSRLIGASLFADVITVLLAWAAGYAFALVVGRPGQVRIEQSLFLNAFLFIQLAGVVSWAFFAPRWPALRPLPIEDTTAAYWYFWLRRLIGLVGYTFLFVAPLLTTDVSERSAEAIRTIVLVTALAIVVAIILQNRDRVGSWLKRRAAGRRMPAFGLSLALLGRVWHVLAILYLLTVFALWISDGNTALTFVLAATGKSAIAIGVGALINASIFRLASGGMRLPRDVKERLPLLQARLNAFVPRVLNVVRIIVSIAVIMTLLQVWRIADVAAWWASGAGQHLAASLASAALVLLVGAVVYLTVHSWIEYRLSASSGRTVGPRERTLLALFRNAFSIVLFVLVFMLVLAELGVNIAPLLAGAGVVGLALGFGSQKLVQDVITGAFIQLENTMNEGDVVTAGGITGSVERLTIRSVALRTLDGAYHVIPFSSVDTVSNFTKHFGYHVANVGVAYREDVAEVKQAMSEAFERLKQTPSAPTIVGELEMRGVTELADSGIVVGARIKTLPGDQWAVGRAYNEIIKEVFNERGIEIPFPHVRLYLGEDKQGHAPPLRVRGDAKEPTARVLGNDENDAARAQEKLEAEPPPGKLIVETSPG